MGDHIEIGLLGDEFHVVVHDLDLVQGVDPHLASFVRVALPEQQG